LLPVLSLITTFSIYPSRNSGNKMVANVKTSGGRKFLKVGPSSVKWAKIQVGTGPKYSGTPWPGVLPANTAGPLHDISGLTC
jgi:hypothetical protein